MKENKIKAVNLSYICMAILLAGSIIAAGYLYLRDENNFDIASFLGAIIGFCGVGITLTYSFEQVNYQIEADRKNSFDSAIGVENYKQLFNMANEIGSYADELVEIEYNSEHLSINEFQNKIKSFDERFYKSMNYFNNNFYSILTYYDKNKEYKEQFNKLYCKAINNRISMHSIAYGDQQRKKLFLGTFEDDLITLKNYMIFVCTKIIK